MGVGGRAQLRGLFTAGRVGSFFLVWYWFGMTQLVLYKHVAKSLQRGGEGGGGAVLAYLSLQINLFKSDCIFFVASVSWPIW